MMEGFFFLSSRARWCSIRVRVTDKDGGVESEVSLGNLG